MNSPPPSSQTMEMVAATRKRNYADFAADALFVETDVLESAVPISSDPTPNPSTARAPSLELVVDVKTEGQDEVEGVNRDRELELSAEYASDPRSSKHGDDEQVPDIEAPEYVSVLYRSRCSNEMCRPHVLESGSVKVIIGQGNVFVKEFVIHADLFKHLSGRLHKIIQSREKEDYEVVVGS